MWEVAFDSLGEQMVSCSDDCSLKVLAPYNPKPYPPKPSPLTTHPRPTATCQLISWGGGL